MSQPEKNNLTDEPAETGRKPKRYRFELGFKELFFYGVGLVLALSWMFVFGIFVGRGVPLVSSDDLSLHAHLMRYLGLGKHTAQQAQPETQETYDSPEKMLESLNYYEDLTKKNGPGTPALRTLPTMPVNPSKQPPAETPPQKTKSPGQQQQSAQDSVSPPPHQGSPNEPVPPTNVGEHFSLLVSSLKDADNAQRLAEQLRSKGYTPRIESLDLSGSGRWNRVLIGFFQNREEALRFAAEFNRKERLEGLVIRESQ